MTLRGQVVDLVRLNLLNHPDQIGRIGQVSVVENEVLVVRVRVLLFSNTLLPIARFTGMVSKGDNEIIIRSLNYDHGKRKTTKNYPFCPSLSRSSVHR